MLIPLLGIRTVIFILVCDQDVIAITLYFFKQ